MKEEATVTNKEAPPTDDRSAHAAERFWSAAAPGGVRPGSGPRLGTVVAMAMAIALSVAGCASTSPPIRYHVVASAPSAADAAGAGGRRYDGPPVVVRGIVLPPGFDRVEMTRRAEGGAFVVREFDQWAAPLSRLARQALVEDLALRLAPDAVVVPGGEVPEARAELRIDVLSYGVANGIATMAVQWTLRTASRPATPGTATAGRRAERPRTVNLETPLPGDDANASAAAWSALLGQLADRVAASLTADALASSAR